VRGLAVIAGIGWLISCSLLLPEAECDVDADCDSGVCDRRARACVAESDVSYVEPEECRPGRLCTREFPCCSIDDGVSGAISQRLPVVHLAPVGYAGPVEIEATTPLRLLGHGATLTVPESDTGLATSGDERLEIDGLAIRGAVGGATQTGLRATGAELSLFQISVRSIAGNGVVAQESGVVEILSSRIGENDESGIQADGVRLVVESTEVFANGQHGIAVDSANGDIHFATIADNALGGIRCLAGVENIAVRGSIVLTPDLGCLSFPGGVPNFIEGVSPGDERPLFADPTTFDYRLVAGSSGIDNSELAGLVAPGDVDVAGNPRDDGNGPDLGANEGAVSD
jgi:hypothetical protein